MSLFRLFKGGVHPDDCKHSKDKKIVKAKAPDVVAIPLQQHIGACNSAIVKVGDKVKMGEAVGRCDSFVSAPVHSSVSGKVIAIENRPHPMGNLVPSIIIENDHKDTPAFKESKKRVDDYTIDELKAMTKEAGIVGMGGATFPSHVKYSPPPGVKLDLFMLNAAECEPYLTCDHRLMIEQPEKVILGMKIVMKVLGITKAYVGIEDNKMDAVHVMEKAVKDHPDIKVQALKTMYPQGAEKMLIYALSGRKVSPGGLPMNIGVVVNNVATVFAVHDAVYHNKPLIDRLVTVTGAVHKPLNILARVGTPIKDLIDMCGGYTSDVGKIISGGPMMGAALSTEDMVVTKGTSGILILSKEDVEKESEEKESPCIQCARCVDACPMNLMPTQMAMFIKGKDWENARRYHVTDCFECGCCSYVCPSKIPLVNHFKHAKVELNKIKQKEQAKLKLQEEKEALKK